MSHFYNFLAKHRKIIISYLFFGTIIFAYGIVVGVKQVFPFSLIESAKFQVELLQVKISNINTNSKKENEKFLTQTNFQFGKEVDNLKSKTLDQRLILNNFEIRWGRVIDKEIKKTGAAEFKNNSVWYINQDDPELLQRSGLTNFMSQKFASGIKAIFTIKDKTFSYITYFDGDCASARIYDLSNFKIALQMPCLPDNVNVDLNGAGGGWTKLNENEILLAVGSPTMSEVYQKINLGTQDNAYLWGKILRLRLESDKLMVSIHSKGLRNPQGLTKVDGIYYVTDHGPMGGDEINVVEENANYGWPLQSIGSEYSLEAINKDYSDPIDTKPPLYSFVPSVGISSISNCPESYVNYYSPNRCVAISSMRGASLFFVVHNNDAVLFAERVEFGSRIREFAFQGDDLIAVTDYEGLIVGKISELGSFNNWNTVTE